MEEGKYGSSKRTRKYEFFSKVVRAGRRTYFFDVRITPDKDFYVTITESKRNNHPDGRTSYERHKIFLYPEDFEEFTKGLAQTSNYVRNNASRIRTYRGAAQPFFIKRAESQEHVPDMGNVARPMERYSDVNFNVENLENR